MFKNMTMKNILLSVFTFLFYAIAASAQWSSDPANPLLVCNLANTQRNAQALPDGSGGTYVFWRDSRAAVNIHKVYGQRYDENGLALWEENGRIILEDEEDIQFFCLYRYDDGKMIIGWYNGADGFANPNDKMWFQELDSEGAKVWENDLAISEEHATSDLSVGSYISCEVLRDALGFHVMMHIQTYGYNRIRISRFSETGELSMAFDGVEIGPLGMGHSNITTDGANGAYVYYSSGNGAGAALYCMHIDEYAGELWADWVHVTAGTTGLAYQFNGIGDSTGITFVWQGELGIENIYARRLLPDGSFDWEGVTTNICAFEGVQRNFYWEKKGDNYYVVWADGRPGQVGYYGIYGQKFSTAGEVFWAEDGIEIADLNTYIPNPKFALDDDLNMYACHQSTVAGYVSQKVADNGTPQWDADGQLVATQGFNPFYEAHKEFFTGNTLLAVWETPGGNGGTDGIYITRINSPQVNTTETVASCNSYTLNDITYTESGTYTQELGGDTLLTLELTINESELQTFDVQTCGPYFFDGELYEQSGTYEHVYTSSAGCDSTLVLSLSITELNTSVIQNGNTLTAATSTAYEWINCDGNISAGVTTQSFTPTETGSYAVIVYSIECADTSECVLVTVIGVEEVMAENSFIIFPNPTSDQLFIRLSNSVSKNITHISIADNTGKLVWQTTSPGNLSVDVSHLAKGIYIVSLEYGGITTHHKFEKINQNN
jgi:hypothetical protein